jgi:hypothetical protein
MLELLGAIVVFAAGFYAGTHYPDLPRRMKRWLNELRNRP